MFRLLRFIWKLFVLASVFGIGYIIGREHSFEEEEDWDNDEDAGTEASASGGAKSAEAKPAEAKSAEAKPAEAKSAEAKPAEAKSGVPTVGDTKVEFTYSDPKATAVAVVGDFNDWSKDRTPLMLDSGVWKVSISLKPGRHEYKFVINNTDWITDPKGPETVADKYGGRSSVIVVH